MEIITSVLVCIAILLMKTLWKMKKKKSRLPGPPTLEAFKSLLNTSSTTGLHVAVTDWAQKYGDVLALKLPGQAIVFLNEADVVKEVFSSEGNKKVTNDRQGTFATKFVFDNGSLGFLQSGQEHSRLRRLFHASLHLYGEGVEAYEIHARNEMDYVVNEIAQQDQVDLEKVLSTSLMNCLHSLLIGRRAERESLSLSAMLDFNNAMNKLLRYELDATLTMFPFLRLIPGYYKVICDDVHESKTRLLHHFFDQSKNEFNAELGQGFIHNILTEQARGAGGKKAEITDSQIKCFILDFLNAGYVTTRGALLGTMLCLINNQDVQQKMYNELQTHIGSREVTLEDRPQLPYLEAVIVEALRYTSHTPFSIPHLSRGDIETRGYTISKGTLLVANLWNIHHDHRVYEDPWVFRPERFLDSAGRLLPKDHPLRRKSIPFGIGKRQCPGESFAKSRLFMYVATLVQNFKFLPLEGERGASADPRTWRPGVILHLPEIVCKVVKRNTSCD
ncbi:cytochrome P450 1A1-like [Haliotis asinina]|uniref:cytochrome P450 1A1-like n=1 Tax=Haliotis asinina TaxID=109174 RepID=UPI0035324DB7